MRFCNRLFFFQRICFDLFVAIVLNSNGCVSISVGLAGSHPKQEQNPGTLKPGTLAAAGSQNWVTWFQFALR